MIHRGTGLMHNGIWFRVDGTIYSKSSVTSFDRRHQIILLSILRHWTRDSQATLALTIQWGIRSLQDWKSEWIRWPHPWRKIWGSLALRQTLACCSPHPFIKGTSDLFSPREQKDQELYALEVLWTKKFNPSSNHSHTWSEVSGGNMRLMILD